MSTPREELRELIDRLPDEVVDNLLIEARDMLENQEHNQSLDWHARMRQLRAELSAKYGEFPSSAEILEEIREERLNDITGGR
jgi:hypothetical protein